MKEKTNDENLVLAEIKQACEEWIRDRKEHSSSFLEQERLFASEKAKAGKIILSILQKGVEKK